MFEFIQLIGSHAGIHNLNILEIWLQVVISATVIPSCIPGESEDNCTALGKPSIVSVA